MTRPAAFAAALALLMTSTAFAQTTSPLESPGQTAPPPPALSGEAPPAGPAMAPPGEAGPAGGPGSEIAPDRERADMARDRRQARREGRRGDDRRSWRERREMMRAHHGDGRGMRGMRGSEGALFRFRGGDDDGSSFVIRCAARDTTEECVEAIMPMLDRVLPD